MGIVQSIKNTIAPRSTEALRADLARAEAAHKAATDAWSEDETAARWKIAEDTEREVKQLRARIGRAERAEASMREEAAAKALAARRAGIAQAVERIERTPALVAAWVDEVAEIGARLARVQQAAYDHESACSKDARFIADECTAIGEAPPLIKNDAPVFASGVVRMCQHAVRARNIADGVSRDVEQAACELVRGTSV